MEKINNKKIFKKLIIYFKGFFKALYLTIKYLVMIIASICMLLFFILGKAVKFIQKSTKNKKTIKKKEKGKNILDDFWG